MMQTTEPQMEVQLSLFEEEAAAPTESAMILRQQRDDLAEALEVMKTDLQGGWRLASAALERIDRGVS